MDLQRLLSAIHIQESKNHKDETIDKIAYHSKECTSHSLFVCIKGYESDGHDYAEEAVKNGAVALVVERFLPELSIPQYLVEDGRVALGALGDRFYNHPSRELSIVGITATNGKTSTTYMTHAIFEENNWYTGLIGTVMVKYGENTIPSTLTTPESLDLHGYFAKMKDENVSHVAMEVSSSAIDLKRVGSVDFNVVVFNNIGRDHIDLHGTFEEYFRIKSSLITNAKKHQFAVLNLDDKYSASLTDKTEASVVTYGIDNKEGHITCKDIDLSSARGNFTVVINKAFKTEKGVVMEPTEFDIALSVAGYHAIYNALAAVTIGLISDVPIEVIQRALNNFKGVERRFQIIYDREFKVIDDYFVNKGSIDSTLKTLSKTDYSDLYIVYSLRGNRGKTINRENAMAIVSWAKTIDIKKMIISLSKSHVTKKDAVLPEELELFIDIMKEHHIEIEVHEEIEEAIESSLKQVSSGDVILLGGAQSMDFGAPTILNKMYEEHPELDKEELFMPLEGRVTGKTVK